MPKTRWEPHWALFPAFPEDLLSLLTKKGQCLVPQPVEGPGHEGRKAELVEGEGSPNPG